jgi:GNAT superfamily N-acetyltransferase
MLNAAGYRVLETLDDSSTVTIRAVRADDKERILAAFHALAPRSIYMRFFHDKKELSEDDLRRITEIDHVAEVALVATVEGSNGEAIIAMGRYVATGTSAELAFTVADDYQGRGIASRLLQHLLPIARANGVVGFEASVLGGNEAMLAVLASTGLPMTTAEADGVVNVTLSLGPEAAPADDAVTRYAAAPSTPAR